MLRPLWPFQAVSMAARSLGLHAHELLERLEGFKSSDPDRKNATARGVRVPCLQIQATARRSMEMRAMQSTVRHFRDASGLSTLWCAIPNYGVPGLPGIAADERMG